MFRWPQEEEDAIDSDGVMSPCNEPPMTTPNKHANKLLIISNC